MSTGSSSKSNQGGSASSHSLRRLDALEADFKAFRRRTNERLGELENCVEDVKALVDNLLPNQEEELQTSVQVLADKVKELQDDATPVSGSRGAISCHQQTSRTRTLTTVGNLLLILSAQICVFDCMNMMSRVRPRICGLYTTKTCHLQIPNGLTLQRRSDRRCCRQHAESSGNGEAYYGMAIRSNIGNKTGMITAIKAILGHFSNNHEYCPDDKTTTWCKFHRNDSTYKPKDIAPEVLVFMEPVFERLLDPDLLERVQR